MGHAKLPYSGYEPGLTPPEQWDAIPLAGKIQIFGIIGMLESYGEILPQHYCNGGLPGYYPPIKGNRFELIFNLYDPFNWFDENKDKVRGRQSRSIMVDSPCWVFSASFLSPRSLARCPLLLA